MFQGKEKLYCNRFEGRFDDEMKGEALNIKYFQEHSFLKPVLDDKFGLGMRM